MTKGQLRAILGGRDPYDMVLPEELEDKAILVTGALGSLGTALCRAIPHAVATDVLASPLAHRMDVTDPLDVNEKFEAFQPDIVFHLAGEKHAPQGEVEPYRAVRTNVMGTAHVLAAAAPGTRVIVASTCKACDPATVYGCTKLVAERMALEHGHTVVRFYNVIEASGNVFEKWEDIDEYDPVPVAPAKRIFMTLDEAIGLLTTAAVCEPGNRYVLAPVVRVAMHDVARALYPSRGRQPILLRRGDRREEPICASHETVHPPLVGHVATVTSDLEHGATTPEPAMVEVLV